MKTLKIILPVLLIMVFLIPIAIDARVYFLYDSETNNILVMGEEETKFTEKVSLNKNPDLIMPTYDPDKYLAIFTPGEQKKGDKKKNQSVAGQLVIFNISTGRTEDLVELGYYPFRWTYTSDYKNFFISYRPAPASSTVELLHYDIANSKTDKISGFAQNVTDLTLSSDGSKIYGLTTSGKKAEPQLINLKYAPFEIINTMPAGEKPIEIFTLDNNRVVIIDQGLKRHKEGCIRLIDMDNNTIIEEAEFNGGGYYSWYKEQRTLIVGIGRPTLGAFGQLKGKGKIFKINGTAIKSWEVPKPWLNFEYIPERDLLYVIREKSLNVVNFNSDPVTIETGYNTYNDGGYIRFYEFMEIPDSNIGLVYCYYNNEVRFIDLNENTLIKTVKCGRKGRWAINSFFGATAKVSITTNPQKSMFYVLNRATQDITVLDRSFNQVSLLTPPEKDKYIGMYQFKKPGSDTLVTTTKKIYKLNYETNTLEPIYDFKTDTSYTYFYQGKNRLILVSDNELLVFDVTNLNLGNQFDLYSNSISTDSTGSNSEEKKPRYHFIKTL